MVYTLTLNKEQQFAEGHEIKAARIKADSEEIRKAVALMRKLAGSWA